MKRIAGEVLPGVVQQSAVDGIWLVGYLDRDWRADIALAECAQSKTEVHVEVRVKVMLVEAAQL